MLDEKPLSFRVLPCCVTSNLILLLCIHSLAFSFTDVWGGRKCACVIEQMKKRMNNEN